MNWKQVCRVASELPEVEESTSYRTPALKVRGKLLARLSEDGTTLVLMVESVEAQQFLIASQPKLYFITAHYEGWPMVLARLTQLRMAECRRRLGDAWHLRAPRSLVKKSLSRTSGAQ